jgi:hypothetical protein
VPKGPVSGCTAPIRNGVDDAEPLLAADALLVPDDVLLAEGVLVFDDALLLHAARLRAPAQTAARTPVRKSFLCGDLECMLALTDLP